MQILKSCGLTLAEDIKNFKLDLHFARKTTRLVYIFHFCYCIFYFYKWRLRKLRPHVVNSYKRPNNISGDSYIRLRTDYLSRSSKMVGSEINRRTRGKWWKTVGRNLRPLLFVTLLYGARARATLSYASVSPLKCSIFP